MKPFHLVFLLLATTAACNKEQIEETCERAAIQKCGDKKSLKAMLCRKTVMAVCVKKLCDLPFNNCNVDTGDPLCATEAECSEPDDATYPDDDTWSYCAPDGVYYDCDGEECVPAGESCPV